MDVARMARRIAALTVAPALVVAGTVGASEAARPIPPTIDLNHVSTSDIGTGARFCNPVGLYTPFDVRRSGTYVVELVVEYLDGTDAGGSPLAGQSTSGDIATVTNAQNSQVQAFAADWSIYNHVNTVVSARLVSVNRKGTRTVVDTSNTIALTTNC